MPAYQRVIDIYYGGYAADGSPLGGFFVVRIGDLTLTILNRWPSAPDWTKPTFLSNCWVFRWGYFVLTWY
jgi:hypothetical protein